jgi:hypothetical protein
VAADASVWLNDYRLGVDVFHFHERRTEGACVRGWEQLRNGSKIRASLLSFSAGPILRIVGKRHVSVVKARRVHRFPPGRLAATAGCSGILAQTLAAAAQGSGRLTMERAYAANRPTVALEIQRGREERLTVFVSPRTDQPLVAFVDLDGRTIAARIYLQPVSRAMLAQFRLLHRIEPVPPG